ncbi:hypothetical protein OIE13_12260 [Streptosporangium sp. NBC_01810]|uniref:hypothetical protein n=1 Tax=Streptosporangium sp. NBC_01810 TaxID=2975951 RepID=UPI002DD97F68|nr:hypothetical protein [Streptosporangium sp. NBC_01810]WSA28576.1 hypothetical protein OIE13_12260 [Streptosporangium sp. NBC_01810]
MQAAAAHLAGSFGARPHLIGGRDTGHVARRVHGIGTVLEGAGRPVPSRTGSHSCTEGGLQRMAARTLAVFLFTDQDSVTAGEIAEQLEASAGQSRARSNRCSRSD